MTWATVQEVAIHGKTGEYIVPGPTKKGMPKKRRARGLAKPPKGGYQAKDVPTEEPMPPQPATPKPKGKKSQKEIRAYPENGDMLELKPFMGRRGKIHIPYYNVSKNRRFIKGVDWAMEKVAVTPTRELANQEKNAAANIRMYKGADAAAKARLNNHLPMNFLRLTASYKIVFQKMTDIATKKGGQGSARALQQSGDPFWYGVYRTGIALSDVADWDALDDWVAKEAVRIYKKYTGLTLNPSTGLIEAAATHHDKNGRFTSPNRAHTVTQGGVRYKQVRQLRKMKGAKTRSKRKPPQEEAVISVIGAPRDREAVDAMLHPAGQWQTAAEVMPRPLSEE